MFETSCRTCALVALALSFAVAGVGQEKAPAPATSEKAPAFPTNEQLRHYKAMSDPQLSPDGKQVLVRIADATADGAKGHIWLVDVGGGGAARQLTYSPEGDKRGEQRGQWMPDGSAVLFLAHRGEHTLLYKLPMKGGEAKAFDLKVAPAVDESKREGALPPVTENKKEEEKVEPVGVDVGSYRVSPDGKWIAVFARDPETAGEKKAKAAKADAEWVDHGLHGERMYLLDVATEKLTVTGVPVDVEGASWSADSTKLVAIARGPNGVDELGPANSAWVLMVSDPTHAMKVDEIPATVGPAVWSHDGAKIIYLAQAKRDAPPGYSDMYVLDVAAKTTKNLTDGFMGTVGHQEPVALVDGGVLQDTEEGVEARLMRYAADGKSSAVKLPVAAVADAATNDAQNGWVFLGSSGGHAPELMYSATLGDVVRVVSTPELEPKGVKSAAPKRVQWKNEKLTIEGLLYLPDDAATKKVPLVVEVHGGPLGAYVDSYSAFTDYLLAQGWAVLRANPRGSTGRGAEFAAANKNDLGGADYRDIMAGVDAMVKTEPVDADRMALIGYSYGGEMAAFVETKTTRFKAIVSAAPVIDQNSEYGTEKGSWYDQWYFGKPWLHPADAWRQSPLSGVEHAKTPFMLLQGDDDTTDPLGQSLEMYHALRQMGVPVELITYPRVDHGPLGGAIYGSPSNEPWHGFDARQRVVTFFSKAFTGAAK
jgi:dipeptidyl aminopeptidase/acylaminoacyl peptidase